MNNQQFPINSKVTFRTDSRNWHGQIKSHTPGGRAVIDTDEGRQFIFDIDQLTTLRDLATYYTDPATEGILAAKQDAAPLEIAEAALDGETITPRR